MYVHITLFNILVYSLAIKWQLFTIPKCSVTDLHHFDVDPDPDPACHFDEDPDAYPDPTFQFDADPWGSGSRSSLSLLCSL